MITFDTVELDGLLDLLRDCPGRIAATVVPGSAGGEALIARLRDALPELRLEVADDAAAPEQLGARAEAIGRDGDSLFIVPVDGRRLDTEAERVDFWQRLNYQRERLASGAVRTCLVLDAENEKALAMVADDLWDWAMVFRFPEAVALQAALTSAPVERSASKVVDTALEEEIEALRSRLQRAREVRLPSNQVARDFIAPLFVKLASAGREKDARELWERQLRGGEALTGLSEEQQAEIRQAAALIRAERRPTFFPAEMDLLASTLTILAREAAPHFREWGGKATEEALKSFVGDKAKQAAQTLGWLKPKIEEKPFARASVETLASGDLDDDEAVEAEDMLQKQLVKLLEKDQALRVGLLKKLDGVEVRLDRRGVAIGVDVEASVIATGDQVIRLMGGNVTFVQGGAATAEPPVTTDTAHAAYLRWVMGRTGFVALGGVDPAVGTDKDRRLHLDAVYTALRTRTPRRAEDELGTDHDAMRRAMAQNDAPPLSALEQLDRHDRLVLLGDPGSGKSTFVAFVALCMAGELHPDVDEIGLELMTSALPKDDGADTAERQEWSREALLPVRVVLRDFAARGLPSDVERPTREHLWSFLEAELSEGQLDDFAAVLKQALENGEALVLLDSLDEVPEASRRRELICTAVMKFVEAYPKCRFVVTSRTYAYQKQDFRLPGFEVAELAPFGDGQIRRFVRRWYGEVAELMDLRPDEAQGRARRLEEAIFSSARLRELAARPLLLTLMASLHSFRGGSLPEDREKLYDDTVALLLDVWEQKQKRHEGGQVVLEPSLLEYLKVERRDVLRLLQELAYEVHGGQPELEGTADIAVGDLVGKLMTLQAKAKDTDVNPAKLAQYLSQRSGILEERGDRVYTFPHRTFQEYLAARHLVDGGFDYDEIARDARRDPNRWREVVLLAAARMGPLAVWELADALGFEGDAEPEAAAWGLHLAGQVVTESANLEQVSPRNQKRLAELRRRLAGLLESPQLPARERALAGNNLARLGDPRFDGEAWCLPAAATAGFVAVPGGEVGLDPERDAKATAREQPLHTVHLSPFWLARWPVTVAQFQTFVKASGFEIEDKNALAGVVNHPVVWVSWDEARAYCEWLTGRLREMAPERVAASDDPTAKRFWRGFASGELRATLPTEAQWEAAARGPDARLYPWGDAPPDDETANFAQAIGGPTTVGIYPRGRGPFGTEDQAGNVAEWCADAWDAAAYAKRAGGPPLVDPCNAEDDSAGRAARGGSWWDGPVLLRAAGRFGWSAGYRSWFRGFRVCVSAPDP